MKINKIAMVFVLLLFAIGTIVPAALSVDSVADLQSKYDESIKKINSAFDKIQDVDLEQDDAKAKLQINEVKTVAQSELVVLKQIRSAMEELISKGDNTQAAQDLLAELNGANFAGIPDLMGLISYLDQKIEARNAAAAFTAVEAKFIASKAKFDAAMANLNIAASPAVSVVKTNNNIVKAETVVLKEVRTTTKKYVNNFDLINLNPVLFNDFDNLLNVVDSHNYLNMILDNEELDIVLYSEAYIANKEGLDVDYKALEAQFTSLKANLNTELCATKTGDNQKLMLKGLSAKAKDFANEANAHATIAGNNADFNIGPELLDWETKFNKLSTDINTHISSAKATDCSVVGSGTDPVVDPVVPPVVLTEWEQYEALDKAFDDAEDDFDDYDAKLEKARDDKDSKDIKKYEGKLEDLSDDTVSDLINDAEDLLDKVEKDKTIENQKLLINKVEDLIDDLESLEDDIKKAIKGTTNSSSNVSSTGSNFVAAKTSTTSSTVPQNAVTGNTVQKISGFPTTGVPQNAVTSTTDKAEFVEIALLVGGLVLVTLVIMFLLAVLLFKK